VTSFAARIRRHAGSAARGRLLGATEHFGLLVGIPTDVGVVVVPHDAAIRRKLLIDGRRGDVTQLERAVELLTARGHEVRGSTFVDLGANHGTTSLAALNGAGFARAVACEPDPENARFLRATIAVNGLEGTLVLVEAAVGAAPGRTSFEPGSMSNAGRLKGAGRVGESAEAIEVEVVSVDSMAERGLFEAGDVGLLWMDVQGYEGHALAGASRLLERGVPVVTAVRAAKLARGDLFVEQVTSRFATLVELRGEPWSPVEQPVGEALERLLGGGARNTDVLLLPRA
jgi:FkbM family methyltransferase